MQYRISKQIAEQIPLTLEEQQLVDELVPVKTFSKGSVLLREGQVPRTCYFVIEGCVRSYYLVDGEEKTTAFYLEGDAVASLTSYLQQLPAPHYLACIEDCQLAVLNYEQEVQLYQYFPALERLCRVYMETAYGKEQHLLATYLTKKPEARYRLLIEQQPALLDRVPLYILASYVGVQPESLSRIRKRIARQEK